MKRCRAGVLTASLAACGSVSQSAGSDAAIDAPSFHDAAKLRSCAPSPLITDVELGDPGFSGACIHGVWTLESFNGVTTPVTVGQPDNTTDVIPVAIAAGFDTKHLASRFAVHVSGHEQQNTPTASSFAQLTASLNALSKTDIGTVDASAYTGIQFFGMVTTGHTGMRLTVGDLYTDPVGGQCIIGGLNKSGCFDNPGAQLAISGMTWTLYQVPFASLTQIGFGLPSPTGVNFPKQAITHIKWDVGIPTDNTATEAWDLWVDDVTFY